MALTAQDRNLLRQCLGHESGAWNDFIDRYLGLIYHVIQHTAHLRSQYLQPEETEDIAAQIVSEIAANDYAVLRQFRLNSSLASYLTVIGRRICVNELAKHAPPRELQSGAGSNETLDKDGPARRPQATSGLEALEEVAKLLKKLPARERKVVQLYFIEGRSYEEISTELNIPINHIGVILRGPARNCVRTSKIRRPRWIRVSSRKRNAELRFTLWLSP